MRRPQESRTQKAQRLLYRLRDCEAAVHGNLAHIQSLRQRLSGSFEKCLSIYELYDNLKAQLDADEDLEETVHWLNDGRILELPEIKISDIAMESTFFKAIAKSKGVAVKS